MSAIRVSGLTKDYGEVRANDEVTFSVEEGEVFGYLGPNGAGKTTTIRTLIGFQSPTDGGATVLGADVTDAEALRTARERIGYLPSNPQFDEQATGTELLDLHASVKDDSRRGELLELFDVPVDRTVRSYSTGQAQKLGLVQAFMHDPELVIMDEPTAGLDPLVQQTFNEFVGAERSSGTTVFLSSHVLSEVRRVCDRVGIIRNGRIVAIEGVEELMTRSGKFVRLRVGTELAPDDVTLPGVHELSTTVVEGPRTEAAAVPTGTSVEAPSTTTELTFTYTGDLDSLVEFVQGFHVRELDVEEAPLERVFARFYDTDRDTLEGA
jgi:ABC-2 type transport system ATP-binding protein